MPYIEANGVRMHYQQEGQGDPIVMIPYLSADHACYSFQVAEYAKKFTCFLVDLRGTGETDAGEEPYSTALFADDIAAFMQAAGLERSHIFGLSLGAGVALQLAAAHPEKAASLSLHSAWHKTDGYLTAILESWKTAAEQTGKVADHVVRNMFPWCFTPNLYNTRPEYIDSLADFVRSRPKQSVSSYKQHVDAVLSHDVADRLGEIQVPAQLTFGRFDAVTSMRYAQPLKDGLQDATLEIFEDCSHAPLYENVEAFNERTLAFLTAQAA